MVLEDDGRRPKELLLPGKESDTETGLSGLNKCVPLLIKQASSCLPDRNGSCCVLHNNQIEKHLFKKEKRKPIMAARSSWASSIMAARSTTGLRGYVSILFEAGGNQLS